MAAEEEWLLDHPELLGVVPTLFSCTMEEIEALKLVPHTRVFSSLFEWVSNESIEAAIIAGDLDDPIIPHTPETHRNARIAAIVTKMRGGTQFPPLTLRYRSKRVPDKRTRFPITVIKIDMLDGNHRYRAMEFVNYKDPINFNVYGSVYKLKQTIRQGLRIRDSKEA